MFIGLCAGIVNVPVPTELSDYLQYLPAPSTLSALWFRTSAEVACKQQQGHLVIRAQSKHYAYRRAQPIQLETGGRGLTLRKPDRAMDVVAGREHSWLQVAFAFGSRKKGQTSVPTALAEAWARWEEESRD